MAVRFILMMALIMVGSADPVPDPDVRVDVKQIVNARCGGGCCDDNCCTFDGKKYRTGDYVEAECMEFCCKSNGQWEFKGINENCCTFVGSECIFQYECVILRYRRGILKYEGIVEDCGKCQVDGDPHIFPFDPIEYGTGTIDRYRLTFDGKFVIAQPNLAKPAVFGVNGEFVPCGSPSSTCIKSITYYERDIFFGSTTEIKLEAGAFRKCTEPVMGNPACEIKASTASRRRSVGPSVEIVNGLNGPILLIKDTLPDVLNVYGYPNVNCILIVGSRGLSVALCSVDKHYPFSYIWAMPNLRIFPTYIHGLCNTYTGKNVTYFPDKDGNQISANSCLIPIRTLHEHYNDITWACAQNWLA